MLALAGRRVVKEAVHLDIDLLLQPQRPLAAGFFRPRIRVRVADLVGQLFQEHLQRVDVMSAKGGHVGVVAL